MDKDDLFTSFMLYYSINVAYALIGCLAVLVFGPLVAGSGISEVKGYLNGVRLVNTINLKTFIGKIISVTFGYSSCLGLGPEGPMVHIGAMIGAGLSSAKSRTLHIRIPNVFERLRSDSEQRDFIASGAAAGITAAFGAPIGGVLFAIEEATSHWSRELTWRTFFGCMASAFTVNLLASSYQNSFTGFGLLTFGVTRSDFRYRYQESFLFALLGVLGGLIGGLFVRFNVQLNLWRKNYVFSSFRKILEVIRNFHCFLVSSKYGLFSEGIIAQLSPNVDLCNCIDSLLHLIWNSNPRVLSSNFRCRYP